MKKQIIFLVGPTGVGKTNVAIELAKRLNAEIISCDSMQVYRHMNILTNCPPKAIRRIIPYHLVNIIDPSEEYSAADFRRNAMGLVKEIHSRKKIPLIVGGTGLYVRALIDGLFDSPKADKELRAKLLLKEENCGSGTLYKELKTVDPDAALKIHPNDLRRIVRALEVFYQTKIPISKLRKETKGLGFEYDIYIFGLRLPLEQLYARIDKRLDEMFKADVVNEVKALAVQPLGRTAIFALGFKELKGYLDGDYSLQETKDLIRHNTYGYAKRQLTWFKADRRIKWLNVSDDSSACEIADRIWNGLF